MKKKLLLIILSVFCLNTINAQVTWELSEDGTLTISGTGDMEDYNSVSYGTNDDEWIGSDAPWDGGLQQKELKKSIKNIIIKNGVTSIGNVAFNECSNLTSVTIPNSVIKIGKMAFEGCSALTSITIPNSVTYIGNYAFQYCSELSSIVFPNASNCDWGSNVFDNTKLFTGDYLYLGDCLYRYNGNEKTATIKNGIIKILSRAFQDCKTLTSVTIPNSVTSIGSSAFSGCSGLNTITIPNSVTSIGQEAFSGCSALTSITIPESVTSIEQEAFSGCSALASITIPVSVTSIGWGAFKDAKLRNIVIKAKTPPSGNSAFSAQSYYHTTLMVPEGSWDAYAYSDKWYQFINIREMTYNEANLTNSKAYMMKSSTEGSYLFYDSVNDCVGELNETALDDTEENNTWMTVEVEGKHYVYNLGAKKFLVSDKANGNSGYSLSDSPVSIDIEDGKDAIVFGKSKEFYMVINDKLNVLEDLESQIATTTGIKEINADANQPTVIYNMNGQIVSDNAKGLYIKNGKKYVK